MHGKTRIKILKNDILEEFANYVLKLDRVYCRLTGEHRLKVWEKSSWRKYCDLRVGSNRMLGTVANFQFKHESVCYLWERRDMCIGNWWWNPETQITLEDLGEGGRIISKWKIGQDIRALIGLIWLRTDTNIRLLWTVLWIFGYIKISKNVLARWGTTSFSKITLFRGVIYASPRGKNG